MSLSVYKAEKKDAQTIAKLHKQEITRAFLSLQSDNFLLSLHQYLIKNEIVFVTKENNVITGFVSATLTTSGLYKRFLIKNIPLLVKFVIRNIFSFSFFKKSMETLLAPKKTSTTTNNNEELPELLVIAVDSAYSRKGYGQLLVRTLDDEFASKGIEKYKVLVGSKLKANNFYIKNGFIKENKIELHKGEISYIYTKKVSSRDQHFPINN